MSVSAVTKVLSWSLLMAFTSSCDLDLHGSSFNFDAIGFLLGFLCLTGIKISDKAKPSAFPEFLI
jgi:hypothetical protein